MFRDTKESIVFESCFICVEMYPYNLTQNSHFRVKVYFFLKKNNRSIWIYKFTM